MSSEYGVETSSGGAGAGHTPVRSSPRVARTGNEKPIEHDHPCPDCGYNLRGLFVGGQCPECGQMIALRRKVHEDTLGDAPVGYLVWMAGAFLLTGLGGLTLPAAMLKEISLIGGAGLSGLLALALGAFAFYAGALGTMRDRPNRTAAGAAVRKREWPRLRAASAVLLAFWPLAAVIDLGGHLTGWSWMPGAAQVLRVPGAAGVIVAAVYWAQLADWARDDTIAWRLRTSAPVLGFLVPLVAAWWLWPTSKVVLPFIFGGLQAILMFIGWIWPLGWSLVMCWVMLQMVFMADQTRWAWKNSKNAEARDLRQARKALQEAARLYVPPVVNPLERAAEAAPARPVAALRPHAATGREGDEAFEPHVGGVAYPEDRPHYKAEDRVQVQRETDQARPYSLDSDDAEQRS